MKKTTATPLHLRDDSCYVCGSAPHADTSEHRYWSNAAARAEFKAESARTRPHGETVEARYVAQHRPY